MPELWFIYAFLSAVLFTVYAVVVRTLLKDKGDAVAFTVIVDFAAACSLLPFLLLEGIEIPSNPKVLVIFLLITIVFAFLDVLFTKSRQLETVANISIGAQLGLIWAFMLGVLFFHERLTVYKISGILLIIIGNFLGIWKGDKVRLSKGMKYLLLGVVVYNSSSFVEKYLVTYFSAVFYKMSTLFLASVWIFIVSTDPWRRIKNEIKLQGWPILLAGPLLGLTLLSFIKGIQVGEVSKVIPVQNVSLILTVLSGIFFLGEKGRVWQKLTAAITVFLGAVVLQMS